MAIIHEQLYKSDNLSVIDFPKYVEALTQDLLSTYSDMCRNIRLITNISVKTLRIENVVPCGLIINELITNSIKHAFPDGKKGEISISMKHENNSRIIMIVSDNGTGFDQEKNKNSSSSIGLMLVKELVRQLDGTMNIKTETGSVYNIIFKEKNFIKDTDL
ncbi:MAG: sensor histidine kinase [Spirochaetes bacterium]|nr:sensor histidine kinase [Spirochaetota bacterium]